MPVKLDPKPADRSLGLYARILVDVDFSRPLLQQLHVSHSKGDSVIVGIEYETQPTICGYCDLVGHVESKCKLQFPLRQFGDVTARSRPPVR